MAGITLADKAYHAIQGSELTDLATWQEALPEEAKSSNRGDSIPYDAGSVREWCFLLGVAYAIRRMEEPFWSEALLAKEATAAANDAFRWWSSVGGDDGSRGEGGNA